MNDKKSLIKLNIDDVPLNIRAYENCNTNFIQAQIPIVYEYPLSVLRFSLNKDATCMIEYNNHIGKIRILYLTSDGKQDVEDLLSVDDFVSRLFGEGLSKFEKFENLIEQ